MKTVVAVLALVLSVSACKDDPIYRNYRSAPGPKPDSLNLTGSHRNTLPGSYLECVAVNDLSTNCRVVADKNLIDSSESTENYSILYNYRCIAPRGDGQTSLVLHFPGDPAVEAVVLKPGKVESLEMKGKGKLELLDRDPEGMARKIWKSGCYLEIKVLEKKAAL